MTEAVERKREPRTVEKEIGTVHEPGRDVRFVCSDAGTVHERPPLAGEDGYALDPKCGQTLPPGSLWSGIDADTAEQVATEYAKTRFCTNCFRNSLKLEQMGREVRS